MTRDDKTAYLVDLALRFWENVETPDANDMDSMLTALAERDASMLRRILTDHGVDCD